MLVPSVVDLQPVDLLPKRDVDATTKLRPVAGPRVRRTVEDRPLAVRVQLPNVPRLGRARHRHRLGTPDTIHVLRRFPGLVGARTQGGAW